MPLICIWEHQICSNIRRNGAPIPKDVQAINPRPDNTIVTQLTKTHALAKATSWSCGNVQVHNLEGHDVKVSAQGPEAVSFQKAQTAEATHCMRLQIAGMYLVHVTVNGHPLGGWPKTLHMTAAASEAARSASACPSPFNFSSRSDAHCFRHTVLEGICYNPAAGHPCCKLWVPQMLPKDFTTCEAAALCSISAISLCRHAAKCCRVVMAHVQWFALTQANN